MKLLNNRINRNYIKRLNQLNANKKVQRNANKNSKNGFENILNKEINNTNVKISAHAQKRLNQRDLNLDNKDMKALEKAMDKAKNKGARESLLLYKDMAFITSIKNKTIITAMDKKNSKSDVFTNIDSAVIVD
ncbi:MAG: flagellar protein [Firmicutes bacterium]|nr:flagellar protein [Bacillota bacterium]